jgi:hypothetical protein
VGTTLDQELIHGSILRSREEKFARIGIVKIDHVGSLTAFLDKGRFLFKISRMFCVVATEKKYTLILEVVVQPKNTPEGELTCSYKYGQQFPNRSPNEDSFGLEHWMCHGLSETIVTKYRLSERK